MPHICLLDLHASRRGAGASERQQLDDRTFRVSKPRGGQITRPATV